MDTDILIVGGGLSGLALADLLEQKGRRWQLVEANPQLGGRILSPEILGAHFDLGPAWFWPGQPRMAELIQRFDLNVFEQYSNGRIVFQDTSGSVHLDRGHSSMQGSLRIQGGMGKLIESLAQCLPAENIHLARRVTALTQHGNQITAQTGENQISASHVVLAIPPRIAAKDIMFDPVLDSTAINALQSVPTWMAGHAKIIAIYDEPYWQQKGFSGDAMSQRGPMVEVHDASPFEHGPYALFGFVGVPPETRENHHDAVIELAKAQLVALFGEELSNPLEVCMQDWALTATAATHQDWIASINHPTYGYPQALQDLWNGQLRFGSTEMGTVFGGFLEGALEAAEGTFSDSKL